MEEAQLGLLQQKLEALKLAQSRAIAALNGICDRPERIGVGYETLYAEQIRSRALDEQKTELMSERHRAQLAKRRGQEKITEQYVAKLSKEDRQRDQAVQLQDVLDSYRGKPPASKQ